MKRKYRVIHKYIGWMIQYKDFLFWKQRGECFYIHKETAEVIVAKLEKEL